MDRFEDILYPVIGELVTRAPPGCSRLYGECSAVTACGFSFHRLRRLYGPIRAKLAQKSPELFNGDQFIAQPGFLTSEAQQHIGEAAPVILFVLREDDPNAGCFGGSTDVGCFMLMSTGCVKPYDSAMTTRLGGRDWNNTTFVPCFSLGRREIPKDLGELKILEEDNLAAVEREATEHQAYMLGYEAAYAANFE